MYRVPFDWLEQWSMNFADAVVVNSEFTKKVVAGVWPGLARRKKLEVIHPCVDVRDTRKLENGKDDGAMWRNRAIVLSINRFEGKKDVGLAIRAYAGLGEEGRKGARLVIAGRVQPHLSPSLSFTDLEL